MPFPTAGWPPRQPRAGARSLRVYISGTATANYSDNAYLFVDIAGANPYSPTPVVMPGSSTPVTLPSQPMGTGAAATDVNHSQTDPALQPPPYHAIWSNSIRICNDGGNPLEFSFDATADSGAGATIHGKLLAAESVIYRQRYESGIAIRSALGTTFRVEAW